MGSTCIHDEEVPLLVVRYVPYSCEEKSCHRVLRISLFGEWMNLVTNDCKEIPVFEKLGCGHPLVHKYWDASILTSLQGKAA